MNSGRGGAVPINIRPTNYVSVVPMYFSVILYFLIQVNVPQPRMPGVESSVRAPSNVSISVKRFCICYWCIISV